jgi:mannose/cellobiose epimerase-like protein (N-acyl-D-glucosamine 2-epimerase family)
MSKWSYSDAVAGYLVGRSHDHIELRGLDGTPLRVHLSTTTSVGKVRNLGGGFVDAGDDLRAGRIRDDSLILAYGPMVPDADGYSHYANVVTVVGELDANPIMAPGWWQSQIGQLAAFYRTAQFGTSPIDYTEYRTFLERDGRKMADHPTQETDTISRMVYGMASCYMLTGEEDYLDVAKAGSAYITEQLRGPSPQPGVASWIFGLRMDPGGEITRLVPSEFPDDYHQIPAYEQIYALAGLTQTFRVTGDPALLQAINETIELFERYYKDLEYGGYFSHIDPQTWSPYSSTLGDNRAKKNWNSNGDHAPAYLFNLYLATGEQRYLDMLKYLFDIIVTHFPRTNTRAKQSPFVQERFLADWTPDEHWGWQQDRAVVGHNLKIAWNLMRMSCLWDDKRLLASASRIAQTMPWFGLDRRRGGWYDVLERAPYSSDRFVWHDRKAWWQQEQAILAYLILAGILDPAYENEAFEAAAFYNANFLDHDCGAVFPTVLATGLPYQVGDERGKGYHAMSMYHSAELCYLAAVYTGLLLRKEPLVLYFKPGPGHQLTNDLLRVAPDTLPAGSVEISQVRIDGQPHEDFDPKALTVTLPQSENDLTVHVTIEAVRE